MTDTMTMNSPTVATADADTPMPHVFGVLVTEVRYELQRALRTRAFSLAAIGFPVMFYCLFGLVLNRGEHVGGVSVAKYLLGGYAVFGSLGAAIFGIGVGVALDINSGWLELKRASPMPPLAYLLAKAVTAMCFSLIITVVLSALGIAVGNVHLSWTEFAKIAGVAALGSVPFSCLGMAMAFLAPPNAAAGIANMIYLPMSFLSGLWVPLALLPRFLQQIAPVFPTYHLAQMMYRALGAPARGSLAQHLFGIVAFTAVMLAVTLAGYKRREQNG